MKLKPRQQAQFINNEQRSKQDEVLTAQDKIYKLKLGDI